MPNMRSTAAKKSFHPPFKHTAPCTTAASTRAVARQLHRSQAFALHAAPSFADDPRAPNTSSTPAPLAPDTTVAASEPFTAPKTASECDAVTPPRGGTTDPLPSTETDVALARCRPSRWQLQQRIDARRAELEGAKAWSLVADTLYWVRVSQAALQHLADSKAAGQVEQVLSELHIDPLTVSPFIPATFTSIPQISRQLPPELMERVCDPVCGGLRPLLSRYAERFESKMIGQVHVVRSRLRQRESTAPCRRANAGAEAGHSFAVPLSSSGNAAATAPKSNSVDLQAIFTELQELFPSYLVPVKALWTTAPEAEEQQVRARVLDALRSPQHRAWLTFHKHPAHCASRSTSADEGERTHVLEHGYVQLRLDPAAGDNRAAAPMPQSPNTRMAGHEVQPYEWYRVARVLPTTARELLFSGELQEQATLLLPPGRDVWHVLLSAPALFELRYAAPTTVHSGQQARVPTLSAEASSSAPACVTYDATPPPSLCASVYVRFRLEERFRVLAQHLFDLLPLRDGVHQSALLGSLPQPAVQAFPQNVTELLQARNDLFQLSDARHGILVQRADAPKVAQRSIESVTGEEILLHIFSSYSLRSDPREGTTISRSLPRLPRLVRERLFAMQDIIAEVLLLYPDKVEVLADRSSNISPLSLSSSPHTSEADERALRELRAVRAFEKWVDWREAIVVSAGHSGTVRLVQSAMGL
ncbi:hypothetical protein CGC21_7195 [Leishmania donovani]|uniref:Uncharacterized protein n=1 Tax=Leishmania donovani TaxID=5661 RepID=A0A504X6E4_LEIDO|nr:hypothetical protein CGC21_7195 [Leishmania donovani]